MDDNSNVSIQMFSSKYYDPYGSHKRSINNHASFIAETFSAITVDKRTGSSCGVTFISALGAIISSKQVFAIK